MEPLRILRLEGAAVGVASLVAFFALDGPLWLLLALALAPYLSMLGYLGGTRLGTATDNAAHNYAPPLLLAGAAVQLDSAVLAQGAVVWVGHIGFDRCLGYGLKFPTGFAQTHLSDTPESPGPHRS